ncbi:MAG: hypothetical protein H0U95_03610 [Bacteroidetes bacterium]|nr:hypothetical protein [Bacteroidota bacterium]
MSFTGKEDHHVTLAEATAWTANFRATQSGTTYTKGHFYGKDAINAILAQAGCVGIRIYYALDDRGDKQLILVGAKADESDMYNGVMAERGISCPPMCPTSPLNG